MIGFIARVLPWLIIALLWYYLNRRLDKIRDKQVAARTHPFWGKLYFLYGWIYSQNMFLTVVRYIITGGLGYLLLRWFFLATSSG